MGIAWTFVYGYFFLMRQASRGDSITKNQRISKSVLKSGKILSGIRKFCKRYQFHYFSFFSYFHYFPYNNCSRLRRSHFVKITLMLAPSAFGYRPTHVMVWNKNVPVLFRHVPVLVKRNREKSGDFDTGWTMLLVLVTRILKCRKHFGLRWKKTEKYSKISML